MILGVTDVPPGTKLFLNGEEIRDVYEADPDEGIVRIYKRDSAGEFIRDDSGEDLVRGELRGQVRIEYPDGWVA